MQRDAQSSGHATELELAAAEAARADVSIVSLWITLAEFLVYVVQEAWPWRRRDDATEQAVSSDHATEQAQSSSHATEQAQSPGHAAEEAPGQGDIVYDEDLEDLVYDQIAAWSQQYEDPVYYSKPHLLRHKRMWDVMVRNKAGVSKENTFLGWCRRVHSIATEHGASDPFKALAEDMLSNDLIPAQRGEKKYMIRRDTETGQITVTNQQRSWMNVVLRKNLGDAKVAYFIFNNGLPELMDVSLRCKAPRTALLKNMIDDLMTWHASLLHSLLDHESHPDMANARKLASLDERSWQQERRENQLNHGRPLSKANA